MVVGSNLLPQSWNEILSNDNLEFQSSGEFKASFREGNPTIVAFFTSPDYAIDQLRKGSDLVSPSSSCAKKSFDLFSSISGETHFAINRAAITLFDQYHDQLEELKNKVILYLLI